ncbi:MAG: preprotein translocase subunit YajC [Alphaproteobacteria bacterium]|jgi:preprotein translocase subunit YajC|nr:preprotein translocase subunit YajC [Alphaproteobacteria bacterium]
MISNLYAAEAATAAAEPSRAYVIMMNLFPFVLIFLIFYFLLIRPQKKKQQNHKNMIDAIKQGDKVLLNAGFKGTVRNVKDNGYFVVEIAHGVDVEVLKSAIVNVIKD